MRQFKKMFAAVFLMSTIFVANAVEDDGFLNPVDLDLRCYFEQT
jgi:hypothetical protein